MSCSVGSSPGPGLVVVGGLVVVVTGLVLGFGVRLGGYWGVGSVSAWSRAERVCSGHGIGRQLELAHHDFVSGGALGALASAGRRYRRCGRQRRRLVGRDAIRWIVGVGDLWCGALAAVFGSHWLDLDAWLISG